MWVRAPPNTVFIKERLIIHVSNRLQEGSEGFSCGRSHSGSRMQVSRYEPRPGDRGVRPQALAGVDSQLAHRDRGAPNTWVPERVALPSEASDSGEGQGPGVMRISHKRTP